MSLKPERRELLDKLVAEGRTISYIHRKHGYNYSTIRRYHPDYKIGSHQRRTTQEKLDAAKDLIRVLEEERAPGSVIAQAVGITYGTLRKYRPDLMWSRKEAAEHAAMVRRVNEVSTAPRGGLIGKS